MGSYVSVTTTDDDTADGAAPSVDLNGPAAGNDSSASYHLSTGGTQAVADATATVADADAGELLQGATVTISAGAQAGDTLTVIVSGGITAAFAGDVLTLTGNASPAEYQAVLRTLSFATSSDSTVVRQLTVEVTDAASNVSNSAMTSVTVLSSSSGASLDVDGNGGNAMAQSDGLLVFAVLAGVTNSDQLSNIIAPDAQNSSQQIITRIQELRDSLVLDVDGNGSVNAQSDGLLIFAILAGVSSSDQLSALIGAGATKNVAEIIAAVDALKAAPAASSASVSQAVVAAQVAPVLADSPTSQLFPPDNAARDNRYMLVPGPELVTSLDTNVEVSGNQAAAEASPTDITPTVASTGFRSWRDVVSSTVDSGTTSGAGESTGQLDSSVLDKLDIEDLLSGEGIADTQSVDRVMEAWAADMSFSPA